MWRRRVVWSTGCNSLLVEILPMSTISKRTTSAQPDWLIWFVIRCPWSIGTSVLIQSKPLPVLVVELNTDMILLLAAVITSPQKIQMRYNPKVGQWRRQWSILQSFSDLGISVVVVWLSQHDECSSTELYRPRALKKEQEEIMQSSERAPSSF